MHREWFRFKDQYSIDWVVFLCDSSDPNLNEKDAITYITHNQIFVAEYPFNPKRTEILALHEILHVVFSGPGEPPITKKVLKAKDDNLMDKEESVVAYIAPKLFTILSQNGFLKFPDK